MPCVEVFGAGKRQTQTPAVLPIVCCASHLLHVRRPVCSKKKWALGEFAGIGAGLDSIPVYR